MSRIIRVTPDVSLEHALDVEDRIARTRRDYTIKGMFLARHQRALGPAFADLRPRLLEPPEGDRYSALAEYPQADHARLGVAVAAKLFPTVSVAEGLRRVERHAAEVFVESTIGRALSGLAASPASALRLFPLAWRHSQVGGAVEAFVQPRARGVRLEMRGLAPWLDCSVLGSIEGAVVMFGRRPRIEAELFSEFDADYVVTWT